jgi:hypothetical protein
MFGLTTLKRLLSGEEEPPKVVMTDAQRSAEKERQMTDEVERAGDVDSCVQLYRRIPPGKHEQTLIAKIEKMARGFDQWHSIAASVGHKSALGELALKRLKELASDSRQLLQIAELSGLESSEKEALYQQAVDAVKSLDDCIRLLECLVDGTILYAKLCPKIYALATTADDWETIAESLDEGHSLQAVALQRRIELATTADELQALYGDLPVDDPKEAMVLQRYRLLDLSLSEWNLIREDDDVLEKLRDIALEREIELTTDPDDLVALLEAIAYDFTDAAETLKTKLTGMGFAIEKWRELAEGCGSQDSEVAALLWKEVVKLTTTAPELMTLHHDLVNDGEEDQDDTVFEAIETKFAQLATLGELKIASLLLDDDDFVQTIDDEIERREKAL